MARLSFYMPDAEMRILKKQAKRRNKSVSAFARTTLRDALSSKSDVQNWWDSVAGKLTDDTFIVPNDANIDSAEIETWG